MPGSSNRFKIHISKENPTLAEKDWFFGCRKQL
jgi:hypothetical protein